MGTLKSQKQAVIQHLKKYGSITSMEAIQNYGATRLSAIIYDLRHKDGYIIETKMLTGKNRFGNISDYGKYILKEELKNE